MSPLQKQGTCLAMYGLNGHPQAWTPLCWSPALEAATHTLIILLGGSLKAEGFGDGFSHIRIHTLLKGLLLLQRELIRNSQEKTSRLSSHFKKMGSSFFLSEPLLDFQ
jgi:hypothetical protein